MRSRKRFASGLRGLSANSAKVLGINRRNLGYIYTHNKRRDYPLADDKLVTKEILTLAGVPVPRTFRVYSNFFELSRLEADLGELDDFVVKPSMGKGGGGILVIGSSTEGAWLSIGGEPYTLYDLKKHISDIIFGVFSFDLCDSAIIEERINQDKSIEEISPLGLADVRIILLNHSPVLAMMRIPTAASDGKANLHLGALGIGLNMETGTTEHGVLNRMPCSRHPDTGVLLGGRVIPHWDAVIEMSRAVAKAVPLKYLGIDIVISTGGPLVLEINVRPGLEIQNANMTGLRAPLESLMRSADKDEESGGAGGAGGST